MEIICDDREKYVTDHMDKYKEKFNIDYRIERITVGDYAIVYKGKILLTIERKTWEDLASSMRDGRKANVKKLLELRDDVGCAVAYLIEGKAWNKPTKLYGRLPVKNLRAHLDHLAFRDSVHMLYAKDCDNTAYRLFEIANNYLTCSIVKDIDKKASVKSDTKGDTKGDVKGGVEDKAIKRLKKKHISMINKQELMIQSLPYIGSIIAALLTDNGVSLAGIAKQQHSIDFIANLKYISGSKIGLSKATKIYNNYKIIASDSIAGGKLQLKIISNIPSVGKKTAVSVLEQFKLIDIINGIISNEQLESVKISKSNVSSKVAKNINEFLQNIMSTI